MENNVKSNEQLQEEMDELNGQFKAFLQTKGIKAKFKLAFDNMGNSAISRHEKDVEEFERIKAQAKKDNKEFYEFLQAKGIKAKYRVIVENIKNGIKNAPENTAAQIASVKAKTQASTACASCDISASVLENEFNAFLAAKGLDKKYTVKVTEE